MSNGMGHLDLTNKNIHANEKTMTLADQVAEEFKQLVDSSINPIVKEQAQNILNNIKKLDPDTEGKPNEIAQKLFKHLVSFCKERDKKSL